MVKLALVFAFFGFIYAASADTLILRNGSTIKGTYVGGTAQTFRMNVGGTVQSYSVKDVESLSIGNSQPQRQTSPLQSAAVSPKAPAAPTAAPAATER